MTVHVAVNISKEAMQWKSIVDLHVRIVLFTSALMGKLHGFASGVIMLSCLSAR